MPVATRTLVWWSDGQVAAARHDARTLTNSSLMFRPRMHTYTISCGLLFPAAYFLLPSGYLHVFDRLAGVSTKNPYPFLCLYLYLYPHRHRENEHPEQSRTRRQGHDRRSGGSGGSGGNRDSDKDVDDKGKKVYLGLCRAARSPSPSPRLRLAGLFAALRGAWV